MALRARFQMLILACFFFKQPINVSYFDILALLSHLNNKTRKKDVFTGCFEKSYVIVKHVQQVVIIRAFCLPEGTY